MVPAIPHGAPTPAYVVDLRKLKANLETADRLRKQAGCKVLLATKAFALPAAFPVMRPYLDGTTASGVFEARMGADAFGKEVHVYSPAYTASEIAELSNVAGHVYFNSARQLHLHRAQALAQGHAIGLRLNPGYSNATLGGALYDPCAPNSRFGETEEGLASVDWTSVHTLHVHSLCESGHGGSIGLIEHVANRFRECVRQVKAVNFGGGHFLNKPGYDLDALIRAVKAFRNEFGVDVYFEPGAGLVVDAGYLISTVVDLHRNGSDLAIMDASASCHMPDVLEVPYRPEIVGAGRGGEKAYTYILGGKTCMTGDVIGTYSFDRPLEPGDRLIFEDMAQYSFVKNNTFNGAPLPDLALLHEDGRYEVVRRFSYSDFIGKLA